MNESEVQVIYNISARRIKAPCLFLKKKEVIKVQKRKPMPGKPGPKK